MKTTIITSLILIGIVSCSSKSSSSIPAEKTVSNKPDLDIGEIVSDTGTMRWTYNTISLDFSDNRANFNFNFSCIYSFKYAVNDNLVRLYWEYERDCPYTLLDSKIKEPKKGTPFASIAINADSSLTINYDDMNWIDKVNLSNDTLFPVQMKLTPYGKW